MNVQADSRPSSAYVIPLVLALVGLTLAVALIAAQSALSLLCCLVFATTAGAKAWSRLSLARVRSRLHLEKSRLFPGESLAVRVEVQNQKLLPVWLQVSLPLTAAFASRPNASDPAGKELAHDSGLLSHQQVAFVWSVTCLRRGVHTLGPTLLTAGDPLGFFRKTRAADSCEVVVYPRLVALQPLALARRDFYGRPGRRSPFEDPTYIQSLRDYQGGRPARYIHWKASAHHNRMVEKLCESTEQEKVLLLLRADGFAADAFESCLEVAASLAATLDRQGLSVGLTSNARLQNGEHAQLKTSSHPGQLANLLELLARVEAVPARGLLSAVQASRLPPLVSVVYFTYQLDADASALLAWLRQRNVPVATVVCDSAWDTTQAQLPGAQAHRLAELRAGASA